MLVRIRPRPDTLFISRGHTVLATGRNGFVEDEPHGLFVRERRVLHELRYLIDGAPPKPNVLSNVEQHSFLGYYIAAAPGVTMPPADHGSGHVPPESQQTLELRVSRTVGEGLHEELVLTNYATETTRFTFAIEVDEAVRRFEIELKPRETWTHVWSAAAEPPLSYCPPKAAALPPHSEIETGNGSVQATLTQAAYDLHALLLRAGARRERPAGALDRVERRPLRRDRNRRRVARPALYPNASSP